MIDRSSVESSPNVPDVASAWWLAEAEHSRQVAVFKGKDLVTESVFQPALIAGPSVLACRRPVDVGPEAAGCWPSCCRARRPFRKGLQPTRPGRRRPCSQGRSGP